MSNPGIYDYDQIVAGINFLWNNRFDEAERIFGSQPNSPRYALHNAEVAFLRSFITADVNDTLQAMTRLQGVTSLAQNCIKAFEKGHYLGDESKKITNQAEQQNRLLDAKIVLGDSLYMTATLQFTRDAKIKGAFNIRKSWKIFENALKEAKKIPQLDEQLSKCLQFGAGFFLFAMSIIPAKFLKLVELAGFKADRDSGLFYVRDAHKNGGIRAPFATMLLLFNDLLLPRGLANVQVYMAEAEELIKDCLVRYPMGSLFQVMGSHCARKQCNVELGIKYMEDALKNCANLKTEPLIYKYELANCYAMKMDWAKAIEQFQPLLTHEKFQVRIISGLQLGTAYVMIGEHKKALDTFNQVVNMNNKKSSIDQMAQRQAKRYLASGGHFSAFELLYLRRDLAKMIPIMPKVLDELEKMGEKTKANQKKELPKKETTGTQSGMAKLGKFGASLGNKLSGIGKKKDVDYTFDDRAAYLMIKGCIVKALGKTEESIEYFKEVIEMGDVLVEKLYLPYTCYELGESYYILGNLKEAEASMKKCSKYSGYDWEDPLRVRLRVTMDQLKKGEKPATQAPPSLDAITSMMENTSIEDKDMDEKDIDALEQKETSSEKDFVEDDEE